MHLKTAKPITEENNLNVKRTADGGFLCGDVLIGGYLMLTIYTTKLLLGYLKKFAQNY